MVIWYEYCHVIVNNYLFFAIAGNLMKPDEFSNYRHFLGQSQSNLADLLGTSLRSVQAYEQGWRDIPPNIERMILYLLYQKQLGQKSVEPCWKNKKCPIRWREKCTVYKYRGRGPCWFVHGTFCEGEKRRSWLEKMETCRTCSLFIRIMESKGC
jgi:DNA-binding XRE family transcriptional regulator